MMRLKVGLICVLIGCAVIADDYLQTPPGQVSGTPAGVIPTYQPEQEQYVPQQYAPQQNAPQPDASQQNQLDPSNYQDPNANIEIDPNDRHRGLEQCRVISQNGAGEIKPYMADSGPNAAGDPAAWIWVPLGMCARLNAGDYTDVPQEILNKIEISQ